MPLTRTFRVFISSTFEDLEEERNALQERVFPRLRRLCQSRGARFQAIDLRWGVSAEAGLDQQTLPLCLEEIGRCRSISPRPNFLVLLGDRYGWQPLPVEIPADVFATLSREVTNAEDCRLLTEWYRRDDNELPPVYVLQPRTVVVPEGAAAKERVAAENAEAVQWRSTETRLRTVLSEAAAVLDLAATNLDLLDASATEQEILTGAFDADTGDTAEHVLAFFRSIDGLPADASAARFLNFDGDVVDADARVRLDDLKTRLRERLGDNVFEYRSQWTPSGITQSHLDSLCEDAFGALAGIIEDELSRLEQEDEDAAETEAHHIWGESRRHAFSGRVDVCDAILDYIGADVSVPLAVVGPSGSGKSAVMAETAARWRDETTTAIVVARFVGATPRSLVGNELLADLCRVIGSAYGTDAAVPDDYSRLVTVFRERLDLATPTRPLCLFIDGIDQLPEGDPARDFGWLPMTLPASVRIVISRSETPASDDITPLPKQIAIPPAAAHEAASMLDQWLAEAGRTLTKDQRQAVLSGFDRCPMPAYLRLAFEDARTWHSYDPVPPLGGDTQVLTRRLIDDLARDANHGPILVEHSLSLLAAARFGLSEDEMIEILSATAEVMADFHRRSPRSPTVTTLPVAVWARLRGDLEPYLAELRAPGATVLRFHHRQLEDTVRALSTEETRAWWHSNLADYFAARPVAADESGDQSVDLRRLSELPYQLAHARRSDELADLLTDPVFLATKVNTMGIQALLADFREARTAGVATPDLIRVEEALTLSAHVISDDPQQLGPQLLGRLGKPDHERVQRLGAGLLQSSGSPLVPVRGALTRAGEALHRTFVGHRNRVNRVGFLGGSDRVVSSSDDGTDRVWDVAAGTVVRVVHNSPGPSQLWVDLPAATTSPADPAGRWAVTVRYNDIVLSSVSGSAPVVLRGHNKSVAALAFSPDGRRLVSGSDDHTVRIWDLERIDSVAPPPHPGGVVRVAVAGDVGFSAGRDGTVRAWSLETGAVTQSWGMGAPVVAFDTASNAVRGAVVCGDRLLHVLDLSHGEFTVVNEAHDGTVTGLAVSADGRRAATTCEDGVIRFWDLVEHELVATVEGPTVAYPSLTMSEDGQLCVCAYGDFALRVWDVGRGVLKATCIGHRGSVNDIRFAAGDRQIISASDDHTIRVWDAAGGFERLLLHGHWHWVRSLASGGEDVAVSVGEDYTVRVWDLSMGAERFSLAGRQVDPFGAPSRAPGEGRTGFAPSGVSGVTLDSSGESAVSFFNNDDTLRLWDVARGSQVAAFTCDQIICGCAMSSDATRIVAGTVEGQVVILRNGDRLHPLVGGEAGGNQLGLFEDAG